MYVCYSQRLFFTLRLALDGVGAAVDAAGSTGDVAFCQLLSEDAVNYTHEYIEIY